MLFKQGPSAHAMAVFALRCTQRLLRRLREAPVTTPPEPSTVLRDWYANVVMVGRRPFVLAVSERTFLPVVVPLSPGRTLKSRIREQVGEVLVRLCIGDAAFAAEMEAMESCVLAKTASRQVVGVLVDFAHLMQARPDWADAPIGLSLKLSRTPCGPLKMGFPDEVTVAAFESWG